MEKEALAEVEKGWKMDFPGYRDAVLIHEGQNSRVYRAHREGDGTPVVLKRLNHDSPTPRETERYQREFDFLCALQGAPHAIHAHALESPGNAPMLVLEDFGADSLAHWLTRYAFSVGEVTAACREIAAGRTENAPPAGEADLVRVVSIHGVRERPENPFDITFPAGILWALIGCAANFGISIVGEKRSGTWARLRFSPLHHFQILLGKGLSCLLTCLLVSALLIGLAVLFFGVRLEQPGKLLLALVSASLFFVGMMAFISVLGRTERAVTAAGWALLLLLGMFGGCMFPLAFMPPWMESLSHASPVKWGILALEGALWRGFSIGELLLPCVILLTAGALLFGVGLAWLTRSEG